MAVARKTAAKGGKPEIIKLGVAVFPVGELHFNYLGKPDTEGEYADNKYKTTVSFDEADEIEVRYTAKDGSKVRKAWAELESQLADEVEFETYEPRLKEYDETSKQYKRFAGKVTINPKSNFQVPVIGPDNEPIDLETTEIWNGSKGRVAVNVQAVKTKMGRYISVQLRAIKVDELRTAGGGGASDFDDEDAAPKAAPKAKPVPKKAPAVDLDDDSIPF